MELLAGAEAGRASTETRTQAHRSKAQVRSPAREALAPTTRRAVLTRWSQVPRPVPLRHRATKGVATRQPAASAAKLAASAPRETPSRIATGVQSGEQIERN